MYSSYSMEEQINVKLEHGETDGCQPITWKNK